MGDNEWTIICIDFQQIVGCEFYYIFLISVLVLSNLPARNLLHVDVQYAHRHVSTIKTILLLLITNRE